MRVAALYDVHGNVHALEAVLAEVDADAIVFGGDLVAGPFPRETLTLARSTAARFVRGNADREPNEQLTDEEQAWLLSLPEQVVLDDVLYVHATPRSDEEIVTPATTAEKLAEILAEVEERLVIAGHTHMQIRRGRYANAGSVGMPYEDQPGAYWALVADGEVEFRRTGYDVEAAAAAMRAVGWAEFAAENVLSVPSREQATEVFGG